jgi:hypothetical protein|tara:strand:- start:1787 stop:2014 length:228 start_codon:yes stop_codon:yes gene_type:complete
MKINEKDFKECFACEEPTKNIYKIFGKSYVTFFSYCKEHSKEYEKKVKKKSLIKRIKNKIFFFKKKLIELKGGKK